MERNQHAGAVHHAWCTALHAKGRLHRLCREQATPTNPYWTLGPFSPSVLRWRMFITLFDATYSAFYLPIGVGWHEWLFRFTWFNVVDFVGSKPPAQGLACPPLHFLALSLLHPRPGTDGTETCRNYIHGRTTATSALLLFGAAHACQGFLKAPLEDFWQGIPVCRPQECCGSASHSCEACCRSLLVSTSRPPVWEQDHVLLL